ncbi:MAG: hypothetical protein Q4G63_01565 [Bacteroidia bacterium]|nr:hypothetical protein [Bacteroidia bacterium]
MIKRIALLSLLICLLHGVRAQSGNEVFSPKVEKGYIELKDGRIIRGEYIYSSELNKIRIITDNESFVMDASEVVKITKKKTVANKTEEESNLEENISKTKKYFIFSELGILPGNPDNTNKMPLIFHTSVNYKFFEKLSAGAGVGVEFYKETYLPVTLNGVYKLNNNRVSPFAMLQVGYQIPIEGSRTKVRHIMPNNSGQFWPGPTIPHDTELEAKGGILLNPSLGVMWQTQSNISFTFSAGYRFHRLRYNNKEKDYNLNVDYNRLSLKLGLIF